MGKFIKSKLAKSDESPAASEGLDAFAQSYPALHEYLTLAKFEDGRKREVSTILVMVDAGRFKACLNDRAESRAVWVSADSLPALLDVLERALSAGEAEWRAVKPYRR